MPEEHVQIDPMNIVANFKQFKPNVVVLTTVVKYVSKFIEVSPKQWYKMFGFMSHN